MATLLFDNYDSFTFNILHYLEAEGEDVVVVTNNTFRAEDVLSYDKLIISPGPGLPQESGVLMQTLEYAWGKMPVLGVCLGMQAIALRAGFALYNLQEPLHGRSRAISHTGSGLFQGISNPTSVGLYHSWAVKESSADNWEFNARTLDGIAMGLCNVELNIHAVQFHPESIMTPEGRAMLRNFLRLSILVP